MEKQIKEKNIELVKEYLGQGAFVYELYGIMIHSGGAHGGHYSAYIKDYESKTDRWFHFNDSYVKEISLVDIPDVFG
jgi:ubiquitin carboxyl-terminal hydrolase 47